MFFIHRIEQQLLLVKLYDQFINSHRKYYHPSNSYIILDGSIDLEAILSLLDYIQIRFLLLATFFI